VTEDFSYVGLEGRVVVAVHDGKVGEVEVHTGRGTEYLFARTAPGKSIERGARVLVVDYHGGRYADVAEWDAERQLAPGIPQPSEPDAPPVEPVPWSPEIHELLDLDDPAPERPDGT
jgi:hypothetical protein